MKLFATFLCVFFANNASAIFNNGLMPHTDAVVWTSGDYRGDYVTPKCEMRIFGDLYQEHIVYLDGFLLSLNNETVNEMAPFHNDDISLDEGNGGLVAFQSTTEQFELVRADAEIAAGLARLANGFRSSCLLVATWQGVTYSGGGPDGPRNTVQLVLASDHTTTFAIFRYARMEWSRSGKGKLSLVGFPSLDRPHTPDSLLDLVKKNNVDNCTPGTYIYRVSDRDGPKGNNVSTCPAHRR